MDTHTASPDPSALWVVTIIVDGGRQHTSVHATWTAAACVVLADLACYPDDSDAAPVYTELEATTTPPESGSWYGTYADDAVEAEITQVDAP